MAWIWDSKVGIATLLLGRRPRDRGSIPGRGVRHITHIIAEEKGAWNFNSTPSYTVMAGPLTT